VLPAGIGDGEQIVLLGGPLPAVLRIRVGGRT